MRWPHRRQHGTPDYDERFVIDGDPEDVLRKLLGVQTDEEPKPREDEDSS